LRKLEDERALSMTKENHRNTEKMRELDYKREVELKKCEVEKMHLDDKLRQDQRNHEKEMKAIDHHHEEKMEQMKRDSKKDDQKFDLLKDEKKAAQEQTMTTIKNNHDLTMKQLIANSDKEIKAIEKDGIMLKNQHELDLETLKLNHEFRMKELELMQKNNNQMYTPNSFQNQNPNPCTQTTNYTYYLPVVYPNQYPNQNPQFEKPIPQNNGYNCPNYQSQPPMPCSFPPPQQGYYQQTPQYQYNNFRQIPPQMMNMNYMQTPPGSY
jgi:hypothetical protein